MAAAGFELETRVHRILSAKDASPLSRLRYALLPLSIASCLGVLFGVPALSASPVVEPPMPARESAAVLEQPEFAFRVDKSDKRPSYSAWSPPLRGDFHALDMFGLVEFAAPKTAEKP